MLRLSSSSTKISQQLNQQFELKCPNCGSVDLVYDHERGEIVCIKCGTVVQERVIDYQQEWRAYSYEEYLLRERTRPISLISPNLGLGIDEIDIKQVTKPSLRSVIERIRRINETLKLSRSVEKNVITLQEVLKPIQTKLNLPNVVIQETIMLYRQLVKMNVKFARLKELAVALLYLSCKKHGIPCRLKELVKECNVSRRTVGKIISRIRQVLTSLKVITISDDEIKRYVIKVLNKLNIPDTKKMLMTKMVLEIVKCSKELHLTNGRSIHSIIASAIYITTTLLNIRKKQKEVAEAAEVTDVTIRSRYKELIDKIDIVISV